MAPSVFVSRHDLVGMSSNFDVSEFTHVCQMEWMRQHIQVDLGRIELVRCIAKPNAFLLPVLARSIVNSMYF